MKINGFEVVTETLRSDAENMEGDIQTLSKVLDKIISDISTLNTMWEGSAKEAFNVQFEIDCEYIRETIKIIDNIAQKMKNAGNKYNQCENRVGELVNSLKI